MILGVLDNTSIESLTKGSDRKVKVKCDDCGIEWITGYRNITGTNGRFCKKCCHKHKRHPILSDENRKRKSKKLSESLKNRNFSDKHKKNLSFSKKKDISYYWDKLKSHSNISLSDNQLFFKCPICNHSFSLSISQINELIRGINQNKIRYVFHSIICKKNYLRKDYFNTLFQNGHNKGGSSWNKSIKTSDITKKRISEGFKRKLSIHKFNMRKSAINRLCKLKENGVILDYPNIGRYETEFLDELQKYTDFKIQRNLEMIGYFPDGYIKELNIIIEFDERHHFKYDQTGKLNYIEKDIIRERNLTEHYNCLFFRVSDFDWLNNREKIINQFKKFISVLRIN